MACMGRSRQDAGRETVAGPRDMTLLGSVGEVLWDSRAKVGLINLNQKEKGFSKFRVFFFKGYTRARGNAHKGC